MKKDLLERGVVDIIGTKELEKALSSGQKLRIKHGVDPTTTSLHLGHAVCYRKLAAFQKRGHQIVFLIGDFTARLGDPAGELKARRLRTKKEVQDMAKNYLDHVGKILDLKKTEVAYNSHWYDKMGLDEFLRLKANFTISQLLERDMFQKRIKDNMEIGSHEIDYPILQAYDSVMLKSDMTICGHDQLFNEMQARKLQPLFDQKPQIIMAMGILTGLDGKRKMSQSLGNDIKIDDQPNDMFGKVMSIPDELILCWFELCTDANLEQIKKDLEAGENPRNLKERLAMEIVTIYHSREAAQKAAENFNQIFREKGLPEEMEIKTFAASNYKLDQLLVETKLASSFSEARRLIKQGGVKIDGEKIEEVGEIGLHDGMILQVGKRKFVKIELN